MVEEVPFNMEEQEMLRKANELRLEARHSRRLRQEEVASGLEKLRKASEAERQRKAARDTEIRAFLRPLAQAFERTGYRIKPVDVTNRSAPVLRIYRSNSHPSETIEIFWQEGFLGDKGFRWE